MNEAEYDGAVNLIYEAALEPVHWRSALINLAEALNTDVFHLLGWDTQSHSDVIGVMSEFPCSSGALDAYQSYYGKLDPRRKLSASLRPGQSIACHHYFDTAFVRRSEFFQDYMARYGLRYSMGGCLHRSDKLDVQIGLIRSSERGPFSSEEQRLFTRLMPHLSRGIRVMLRGEMLERQAQISQLGIDLCPLAVVALDRIGRPVYCNRRAEALLRIGSVLTLHGGRLRAEDTRQDQHLQAAFELILQTQRPSNLLMNATSNGAKDVLSLALIKAPEQGPFSLHARAVILCLISTLTSRRIATARQLMELFSMTAAEARLTRALAHGMRLEDYALEHDLRVPTVKSQLRSVFIKTGTARQAELIRFVTAIPAVRA